MNAFNIPVGLWDAFARIYPQDAPLVEKAMKSGSVVWSLERISAMNTWTIFSQGFRSAPPVDAVPGEPVAGFEPPNEVWLSPSSSTGEWNGMHVRSGPGPHGFIDPRAPTVMAHRYVLAAPVASRAGSEPVTHHKPKSGMESTSYRCQCKGGSDYCYFCGHSPKPVCPTMAHLVPVAAFGCAKEALESIPDRCAVWCGNLDMCPHSVAPIAPAAEAEPTLSPKTIARLNEIAGSPDSKWEHVFRAGHDAAAAEPTYPLPDSLYPGSKDWLSGDYGARVEWLHTMYESVKLERDELLTTSAAEPSELTTCNCRWKGEKLVQQCTLHEAWRDAIRDWSERAKVAERQLSDRAGVASLVASEVPEFQLAFDKDHAGAEPVTALEQFVLDNEPAGEPMESHFREGLAAMLSEVTGRAWRASAGEAQS